jgi:hypothetical protein
MKKLIFLSYKSVGPIVFILLISYFACDKHNDPPTLSDISAPDSLMRGDTTAYLISVMAIDPDGAGDIDSVYFISTKPDSTSNGNHFALNDDGQIGDATAGDNLYSTYIQAPIPTAQLGNYIFTFYARDKHGNNSNNPTVTVTVY